MSLALAYVDTDLVHAASAGSDSGLVVDVVGEARPARILPTAPYDPEGARLRS
jgi:glycine cleavage system aminomethyltransferase T